MNAADFEASRHEMLSRRMRSAKATGHVPSWPVSDASDADVAAANAGTENSLMQEAVVEEQPPRDELAAPSPASQCALLICVLASIAAAIVVTQLIIHRDRYQYHD